MAARGLVNGRGPRRKAWEGWSEAEGLTANLPADVHKQKGPAGIIQSDLRRTAAAYSPTWWGSTIGDGGLNFSVRNGKRWYPAAIATAVCYLRETTHDALTSEYAFFFSLQLQLIGYLSPQERFRAISTGRLKTLLPLHLLPIDVVVSHDPLRKSHLEDGFALRCFQRLS